MANVCAQVSLVDDAVGRVLAELDRRGLSGDTLVLFTADQANLYGQHGLWGHTTNVFPAHLYDAGLRIPLIVRWPGHVSAGQVSEQLIGRYDIGPSIVDYLGFSDVGFAGSPGRSFASLLRGQSTENWPEAVFFEQEESRGIRTSR